MLIDEGRRQLHDVMSHLFHGHRRARFVKLFPAMGHLEAQPPGVLGTCNRQQWKIDLISVWRMIEIDQAENISSANTTAEESMASVYERPVLASTTAHLPHGTQASARQPPPP